MCSVFNVKCSWDGLLGQRNCFCVWLFWCSGLCSVDQTVTVQRGSVLDMRVQIYFACPFPFSFSSWRVGRVVLMIRSAVRTTLRSLLRSDLVAELNQTVIDVAEDGFNDGRVELYQQFLWQVELPQLVKEVQPLLGPFLVIDRYWFFRTDTDTDYLYVYVPENRYAEPIFIYCYKVNK